jgi:hypothetical protein
MSNKDTIIEALMMQLKLEREANIALLKRIEDDEKPVSNYLYKEVVKVIIDEAVNQKREWVGLTDEEIYDYADKFLYQHGSNYGIKSFGKAIEAKLKEKNT